MTESRLGLRPHLRYASYVVRHKLFVLQAGTWTGSWYAANRERIRLHPETRRAVEELLS